MTDEMHEGFLKALDDSQAAVIRVAIHLLANGHDVLIPAMSRAPERKDWKDFSDGGDLFVVREGRRYRLEVKHLSSNFTNRDDWPFAPHYIVNSKGSHDRAHPVPSAYFAVNKEMTHVGEVRVGKTHEDWTVEQRGDSRRPSLAAREQYLCPLHLVKFYPLEGLNE